MPASTADIPATAPMDRRSLWSRTDRTSSQLIRYILVGTAGLAVDFSALFILTEWIGLHYLLSAAAAFLAGLLVNYALCIAWVFHRRSLERRWLEFVIYALTGILGLALNELVIWFFTEHFGLHYLFSKCFYLGVFLLLFAVRKTLLFR